MVQLLRTRLNELAALRSAYFKSLPCFQELYMEMLVNDSHCYRIVMNQRDVGYFILTSSNILVEFYLVDAYVPNSEGIFQTIIRDHSIHTIYCKSFDALLLDCCLQQAVSHQAIGCLFRDYYSTNDYSLNGLNSRFATLADYSFLLQQKDGLYETPEELHQFVSGRNVLMYMNNEDLYGCGYLIQVHPEWDYYDIGMWVNPRFRKQGIATGIISDLKQRCLQNNWIPICGCAYENTASRKTLEKNGFVSRYKLVEFNLSYEYALTT